MSVKTTSAARGSSQRVALTQGWRLCATAPGQCSSPDEIGALPDTAWIDAPQLGTAAAVLRDTGRWSLDAPAPAFDAQDWWYCTRFAPAADPHADPIWLGFDGLATVAEVWLNGQRLLASANMHLQHECELSGLLRATDNELVLRFHALDPLLQARRPRPRWRVPMVPQQQLRWFRTTLLGRTPGWSPPAPPVGPLGDIWWERRSPFEPQAVQLSATLDAEGTGRVDVACALGPSAGPLLERIELEVEREGVLQRVALTCGEGGQHRATLRIAQPALWWPHTHGEPALYEARLLVHARDGSAPRVRPLPPFGLRRVELDGHGGRLALRVNGVPVFCRGACWTPLDVVTLRSTPEAVQAAVGQAREAGMNMLRVAGTLVYEDEAFFRACDRLGVLVWQEFMFANMDYPEHDADFMASVQAEAAQQLARWQGHPSIAVVCGNSEVEQQAAMWGAPRELWSPPLFHVSLREWVEAALPGVPYWPSSAHGGAFPHQAQAGSTSYYGVGAYRRALDDARRCELSFATECLAFANVPDEPTLARMPGGLSLRVHHPAWKQRTPRDLSAGWDFEDVRDHYLASLYGVDPVTLRSVDHDRYLALSRVVTGEVMAAAYAEWRRPGSRCGGALVWFLRDLWAGAGWGLVDDQGAPKPCLPILARALQPVGVFITDEGVNGLAAHVVNDTALPLSATLVLHLYGPGDAQVGEARWPVNVPPHDGRSWPLAEALPGFVDLSYAYRFGPAPVHLVHACLQAADRAVQAEAFHFPAGRAQPVHDELGLCARYEPASGLLHLATRRFAQHVHIALDGHRPADDYFHLAPGAVRRLAMRPERPSGGKPPKGTVWALNGARPVPIEIVS